MTTIADWSPEYPFIDVFKTSREWITHGENIHADWNTGESDQLVLDEHGWVRFLPTSGTSPRFRSVGTLLFSKLDGNYPGGNYTVLYDGSGELTYRLDATKNTALSTPGRDIITVTPGQTGNGIHLIITQTDPNDYIRNIRVIPPEFDPDTVDAYQFHPDFLESIASYGTLRFMDWQRTNWSVSREIIRSSTSSATMQHPLDNPEFDPNLRTGSWSQFKGWAGRSQTTDARYSTDQGVPFEIMVDLANLNNANAWFNVPHLAENNYVWEMAKLVHDRLQTDRYVYLEYTNESWNTAFGQGDWIKSQGIETWGWSVDPNLARWQWYGKRSAEICDIWKDTWGDDADRIICVMATHAANAYIAEEMLECPLRSFQGCYQNMDAIAIAPYFGQHLGDSQHQQAVLGWTYQADGGMNKLFAELNTGSMLTSNAIGRTNVDDAIANIETYKLLADKYGLDLVAYEGGQHLAATGPVQNQPRILAMFEQANEDPRMGEIYSRYLEAWHDLGGTMFVHYVNTGNWGTWGTWGAQKYYNDPDSVKYPALMSYADTCTCTWKGCTQDLGLDPKIWLPILIAP
ncbi:MAG: cellulose-binding protein [Candidatus Promineifilaceae bacterium]